MRNEVLLMLSRVKDVASMIERLPHSDVITAMKDATQCEATAKVMAIDVLMRPLRPR